MVYLWHHSPPGQIYFDIDESQAIVPMYQLLSKCILTNFEKHVKAFFPTDIKSKMDLRHE